MSSNEALIALFIKDGASKLIDFAESSLNKKKGKKINAEENIDMHPSVYNFILLKPFKPAFSYANQEILRNLEGKTRSSILFKRQEDAHIKDINSFKMLYKKYLNAPKQDSKIVKDKSILSRGLEVKIGSQIFSKELENTEIALSLQKIGRSIDQIKAQSHCTNEQFSKTIDFKMLERRAQREHSSYCQSLFLQMQNASNLSSKAFEVKSQSEQICSRIISQTINRWFTSLLEAMGLKEMLATPKMIVEWESNLIQMEKQQLLAQQINGKLLFSIEESISHLKQSTKQLDYAKQYHLRQKKYGIHSHTVGQPTTKNDNFNGRNIKQSQVSSIPFSQSFKTMNKTLGQQFPEQSYSQIANRVNSLRRNLTPTSIKFNQQDQRQSNLPVKAIQKKDTSKSKERQNNTYQYAYRYKKPTTPLKSEDIDNYEYSKGQRSKKLQPNHRVTLKNPIPQPSLKSKIEIKFPIKIDRFEMYSLTSSLLCYQAEQINLKQLPLMFIKDRHKFGENRVKIEYPCKPSASITDLVCKSMQILNCLGAIVFCEEEVSYKSMNSIDESEILAVSWLIEKPVRQVIKYYEEYSAGCPTKK